MKSALALLVLGAGAALAPGVAPGIAQGVAQGAAAEEAPRLAGIIVAGSMRVAIFALPDKSVLSVQEGEAVGRYVVRDIQHGQVRLEGGGQILLLTPAGLQQSASAPASADAGGVTFGVVLHAQPPVPD